MIYMKSKKLYHVNGSSIYYSLSGNICISQYIINEFNNGIVGLNSKDILIITQNNNNTDFEVDLSKFNISNTKENYYTIVSVDEILKIINSGEKYRFKILRYFLYLVSTFMCSSKDKYVPPISHRSGNQMIIDLGFKNVKTAYRYNEILQNLGLIYVYKAGDFLEVTDKNDIRSIKSISNTYGRYKDKDIIIQEGKNYVEGYGVKTKELAEIKKSKSTRSASQKFNLWCNGKKEYSYDELKKIYTTLVEHNKKYDGIKLDAHKDLTIFKEYDFYKPPENEDLQQELFQIEEN